MITPVAINEARTPTGLWVCRGRVHEVNAWAAKSVVPVLVAQRGRHTVVVPRGVCAVSAPYDDVSLMCAARLAPKRVAPAVGFWVIGGRAVLTVQAKQWRRRIRWVIWDPRFGVIRPPGIPIATPDEVVSAAEGGNRYELIDIFRQRRRRPQRLLSGLVNVLGLPGGDALMDPTVPSSWPGGVRHEPDPEHAWLFEDAVKDAVALRRELGVRA